jgi:hypothetical protein
VRGTWDLVTGETGRKNDSRKILLWKKPVSNIVIASLAPAHSWRDGA